MIKGRTLVRRGDSYAFIFLRTPDAEA
jgi:hypothetical protein